MYSFIMAFKYLETDTSFPQYVISQQIVLMELKSF